MAEPAINISNPTVIIADSKTVNGIGDMPLTQVAREAFRRQMEESAGSEYLFPSPKLGTAKPHMTNPRKVRAGTLKRAGVAYLAPYELRHTFATRLSARRLQSWIEERTSG